MLRDALDAEYSDRTGRSASCRASSWGRGSQWGPGRLTKMLGVTKHYDGRQANSVTGLWIEEGTGVPRRQIQRTPRIGVDYAKEWAEKPLRYVVDPNIFEVRSVITDGLCQ